MTYTYYLHDLAYKDYYEAYAWYEEKQIGLGDRFLKAVRNKLDKTDLNPKAYGIKTINFSEKRRLSFSHT